MTTVLTGKDTQIFGGRVLRDLPDGDVTTIDFPNDLVTAKVGKNGNAIYAFNASGLICEVTQRVFRGSDDDKYFSSQIASYIQDPAAYVTMSGNFVKKIGHGDGTTTNDTYVFSGGIIKKFPTAKDNVEGDSEAAVTTYNIVFTNPSRALL